MALSSAIYRWYADNGPAMLEEEIVLGWLLPREQQPAQMQPHPINPQIQL